MLIPTEETDQAVNILEDLKVVDYDYHRLPSGKTRFKIVIRKQRSDQILESLHQNFSSQDGFRLIMTSIEAYLPYPEEDEEIDSFDLKQEMITREEIYVQVEDMASLNTIYLLMVVLSSLIATVGVINNNVAVIIAAMIIAPLMGPGIGLSFGLTMGDKKLIVMALKTSLVGIVISFIISVIMGIFMEVDPTVPAIITRTNVGQGGFILALASGFAGALALTTQLSSTLVGVMIGISLMPPLVTFGLLLATGEYLLAWGALLIFLVNLVSIYLAALLTFYAEKIQPLEEEKVKSARKMAKIGIIIFFIILILLFVADIFQSILWSFYMMQFPGLIP